MIRSNILGQRISLKMSTFELTKVESKSVEIEQKPTRSFARAQSMSHQKSILPGKHSFPLSS